VVPGNGLLKGIHHLWTYQVLRWDHIAQIELESLLEDMSPALPIPLADGNQPLVKSSIDFSSELLNRWG
jgi:hypothetical protein